MSTKEFSRLAVVQDFAKGHISGTIAAQKLGLTYRQAFRLRRKFIEKGPAALTSPLRGRPSNRRLPDVLRRQALDLILAHYADFGPTLAAEKLFERHGFSVSVETLRRWMQKEGIWVNRAARRKPFHQPRPRRDCFGELVQIDGSEHWWFEDRGPQCTLLVYVDDATSRLMHLQFVESESTFSYFAATTAYLEKHGKPVAFYSDKHGVFRVNSRGAVGGDGMTQFGRALHEMNIDIICANTPQAKGRVERANKTLQDRLVKELRLLGISTIEAANPMLPAFMEDYNRRFGKEPANAKNLHRPVRPEEDLTEAFAWREERTVSGSLTVQYDKMLFLLEENEISRASARKRVTIKDYPDGRVVISYKGHPLPYRTFDKARQITQGAIVDIKRLGTVLSVIKQSQEQNGVHRSQHAPRRLDQSDSIFGRPSEPMSAVKKKRRALKAGSTKRPRTTNSSLTHVGTAAISEPPLAAIHERLPLNFDASRPIASPDSFLERELLLTELRNLKADRERMLLNHRRYVSRMKYLKASTSERPDKLAA
jgi:hypothetical protein